MAFRGRLTHPEKRQDTLRMPLMSHYEASARFRREWGRILGKNRRLLLALARSTHRHPDVAMYMRGCRRSKNCETIPSGGTRSSRESAGITADNWTRLARPTTFFVLVLGGTTMMFAGAEARSADSYHRYRRCSPRSPVRRYRNGCRSDRGGHSGQARDRSGVTAGVLLHPCFQD